MTTSPSNDAKKVLIADDDSAIVDALALMLEDEGYVVAVITSGDIVLAAQRERPDVILLDIRLSGQDGREICRSLKQHEATGPIPVIMVSANPDGAAIAGAAGADDFIEKPFELDDLLAKIATFTGRGD